MSNVHYTAALKAVVASESKASNFWQSLVLFVMDEKPASKDALKGAFEREEKAQTVTKKKLSTFGAYRSAKSVITSALVYDVALMDGEKVRGKTEVEKDIKAMKANDKTELDKFKATLNTANAIGIKLETEADLSEAFVLADGLARKLANMLVAVKAGKPATDGLAE